MIVPLHVDFNDPTLIAEIKLKGWVLCDGDHGTPDLRGRFIWGGSQGRRNNNDLSPSNNDATDHPYALWGTGDNQVVGGAASSTLSSQNIPAHNHDTNVGAFNGGSTREGGLNPNYKHGSISTSTWGGLDGSTVPHNNLPPYIVLAYFMYLPSVNLDPPLDYYPGMLKNE